MSPENAPSMGMRPSGFILTTDNIYKKAFGPL